MDGIEFMQIAAKVDSDGKTVVKNGDRIYILKNKWTTGPYSNEENLQQSKLQLKKNPTSSTSKQLMERIEKLEDSKRKHEEELKDFLDQYKEMEPKQEGGRKKTKTYKKRSNKKKSNKKGRHSRRRQSKKY
jgi:hypothetical protein